MAVALQSDPFDFPLADFMEGMKGYAADLASVTATPRLLMPEPAYVPAVGDRVCIVDADFLDEDRTIVGTVTSTSCTSIFNDTGTDRLHPIEVALDDGQIWSAVEVELIETAAEIAQYEEAMAEARAYSIPQRVMFGMAPEDAALIAESERILAALDSGARADDGTEWAEVDGGAYARVVEDVNAPAGFHGAWVDDRTPEQVAESDRAIEALRARYAGEVRVTSATGGSKASKLARYDLIPTGPLRELAEHYGKGAAKYERVNGLDNWRNGYAWSLSYAALQRHTNAFWQGEDFDPENGSKHLIAAAWHCLTLAHWMNDKGLTTQFDDRQDGV